MMCNCAWVKSQPTMLKFLPIMLLSNTQKVAYYAQYYAHNYCSYATVHIIFNNQISIVSSSPLCFNFYIPYMIGCSTLIFDLAICSIL